MDILRKIEWGIPGWVVKKENIKTYLKG
jgi:hypothetical protein